MITLRRRPLGKQAPFRAATPPDVAMHAPEPHTTPAALIIPEREVRRHGPGNILAVCWRQWRGERALARRGVHFRATDPEVVAAAYAAMSDREFEAINGRQDWANWRTIPRCLSGRLPER